MATGAEVGASAGSLLARVAANSVEEELEVDAGMEVDAAAVAVEAPEEATMEAAAAGLLVAGLGGQHRRWWWRRWRWRGQRGAGWMLGRWRGW